MKIRLFLLLSLTFTISSLSATEQDAENIYKKELIAFEQSAEHKIIFDNKAPLGLPSIHRDIENYKELTQFQRFVRCMFYLFDPVVVTAKTMPKLYAYIENLCQKNNVTMPTVFISTQKDFFNAAAQKLLTSSGAIIIGKDIIDETTDQQVEAIIAHEIGHIKHNHVNKILGLLLATGLGVKIIQDYFLNKSSQSLPNKGVMEAFADSYLKMFLLSTIVNIIINKRFEKEADQFAFENGKAEGVAGVFEYMLQNEQDRNNKFDITYDAIQESKSQMYTGDHLGLLGNYYAAKAIHLMRKGLLWFYGHTPFGPHPCHEDRIAAAKEYLKINSQEIA